MRDAVKVARQVRINDVGVSGVQQAMNRCYRVLRSPTFPIGVLFGLQVGFKDGFQHDHGGRLYDSVGDRRYPQRAQFAVRLRYPDSLHRFRLVVFLLQPFRQFPKPAFFSVRFDVFEVLPIHSGRSLVGFAASVGIFQDVPSIDLVVQEVKPVIGFFLRFGM